ncbi:hypothetical protein BCT04_02690 [Vibrio breoganii]|uniref:hypothetical protein n=1 Tax=Vibrio breoganii TaxID=553239 RepID=UPI000C81F50A|nr:hypothetical protein [Vibrio breoganii]PMK28066.1 hypothetical protein BCU06_17425 [Vibrio breoganii]PMO72562.1 hypothetical protein BCT04_02690 [Vibrio breoganii]
MKRRFIRIYEIEQKTSFTLGDILDLIENGELNYSALISSSGLGAILMRNKINTAVSVFNYEGIVGLTSEDSREIVRNGKLPAIKFVQVKELEKVTGWDSITSYFGSIENSRVAFDPQKYKLPMKPFWAFSKLGLGQSVGQVTKNLLVDIVKQLKPVAPKNHLPFSEDHKNYLQSEHLFIKESHLRIDLLDLEIATGISNAVYPSKKENSYSNTEINPIKLIIERVFFKEPKLKSRQVWNLIRKDVNEGNRQFDIDSVVFEMTGEELHYFGLGDTTYKQSYRRFQNLVSEVRAKLHG